MVKNPPANTGDVRDVGLIPGWGRSLGGRHGNPLQYSCLEKPLDTGTWWATTVYRATESDTTEALSYAMLCYAKSLQSCPSLCDPIDGSPLGSVVPGILHARILEWVAISFSSA